MPTAVIAQARHFRGRLARRIFVYYILLSMAMVGLVGGIVFVRASQLVQDPALQQFISTFQSYAISTAVTLGIAILITGLAFWAVTNRLLGPLADVSKALQRLTNGSQEPGIPVERDDEIGMLADSFNQIADDYHRLNTTLDEMLAAGVNEFRTSAELAQIAVSSQSLDELLPRVLRIIATQFHFLYVSAYLIDETSKTAVLKFTFGPLASDMKTEGTRVIADSPSLVGWVIANNMARVDRVANEAGSPRSEEFHPGAEAEAGIPIAMGGQVLGLIRIQVSDRYQIDKAVITNLQHLANQIAPAIRSLQIIAATQTGLQETTVLYQASYKIAQSETAEDIFQSVTQALEQTTYYGMILDFHGDRPRVAASSLANPNYFDESETLRSLSQTDVDAAFLSSHFVVQDLDNSSQLPDGLVLLSRRVNPDRAAFLPVVRAGHVVALLVLGARRKGAGMQSMLTSTSLQPYSNLIELATTSLEKVQALEAIRIQLAELHTLHTVSQAISQETDLNALYALIHRQITQVMGEVSFLIALYDPRTNQIFLPYMIESGQALTADPFPLGEGLTSILIKTQKPLLLVENAEEKLRELGAKIVGRPARSWLGVPLLFGGEAMGAIIVQDVEQEGRFDESDLRLLTTLSAQIAVVIRNASLLESAHRQAERQRQMFEITSKIRHSTDIPSILRITTEEISRALDARRAHIQLQVLPASTDSPGGQEAGTL